jgi:hypothetical protein
MSWFKVKMLNKFDNKSTFSFRFSFPKCMKQSNNLVILFIKWFKPMEMFKKLGIVCEKNNFSLFWCQLTYYIKDFDILTIQKSSLTPSCFASFQCSLDCCFSIKYFAFPTPLLVICGLCSSSVDACLCVYLEEFGQ